MKARCLAGLLTLVGVAVACGVLLSTAAAQPPSAGNGAKRFDDLREPNNKLERVIREVGGAPLG